ncbi:MAG: universal stress protein [Chloroflexota bacterium]
MKERILVPLDGSALAEQALPHAVALGQGLSAGLELLRTVVILPDAGDLLSEAGLEEAALIDRLDAEARAYLTKIAARLEAPGLKVQCTVEHGPAAETIVAHAERHAARLIVMATHGYTGIKRWSHGSVAERVLQSAGVPVLMVRGQDGEVKVAASAAAIRRVLVTLDGSSTAEQVLPAIAPIAQALESELVLFRVPIVYASGTLMGEWYLPAQGTFEMAEQSVQAYLDTTAQRLRERGLQVSTAMRIGPVADSIIEYAAVNRIDLIAICTHGRTGLARWALGSVADRVLRAGNVPILLVRANKE